MKWRGEGEGREREEREGRERDKRKKEQRLECTYFSDVLGTVFGDDWSQRFLYYSLLQGHDLLMRKLREGYLSLCNNLPRPDDKC